MTPRPSTTAAVTAIGYARRSHASDARAVSLAAQRGAIERAAKEQGWSLVAVVEHDGISGGKRSRFGALDAAITAHKARVVICYSLDRLGRDAAGLIDWAASAVRRHIEVHICGRGRLDATTSSGFLGFSVEAVVSEHYRRSCGEKTALALGHLRSAGRRWTRIPPLGSRWADGKAEPEPAELALISRAHELRTQGLSLRAISAKLAGERKFAGSGRPICPAVLHAIFRRSSS